jgi:hypothetical protein
MNEIERPTRISTFGHIACGIEKPPLSLVSKHRKPENDGESQELTILLREPSRQYR